MPNPELEALREYYLKRKRVLLMDEIDFDSAGVAIAELAQQAMDDPEHIDLVFCSPGGVTDAGFLIAQFIEFELDVPVHGYVLGMCNSAATYPLLCCKKRFGNELTTFVLHRHTSEIQFAYDSNFEHSLDGWRKDNKLVHKRQVRFYSKKLGKPKKEVEKLLVRGTAKTNFRLTAKQALRLGLLTDILPLARATAR